MEEKWLPIKGYEGLYEISNLGRVKSLPRIVICNRYGGKRLTRKRILKYGVGNNGYSVVVLCKNKQKTNTIHKLIASHFLGECPVGYEIDHKDNDRTNNKLNNLRYIPRIENRAHKGESHGCSKLTQKQVDCMRKLYSVGNITQTKLAKLFNINQGHLTRILNNKSWVKQ